MYISYLIHMALKEDGCFVIRYVFHQGGLSSGWSFIRVVSSQGSLSSGWSLLMVVFHQVGLSSSGAPLYHSPSPPKTTTTTPEHPLMPPALTHILPFALFVLPFLSQHKTQTCTAPPTQHFYAFGSSALWCQIQVRHMHRSQYKAAHVYGQCHPSECTHWSGVSMQCTTYRLVSQP